MDTKLHSCLGGLWTVVNHFTCTLKYTEIPYDENQINCAYKNTPDQFILAWMEL